MLNDEAAAVLEILLDGPTSLEQLSLDLAADSGSSPGEVELQLRAALPHLVELGFVVEAPEVLTGART